jgi:hypothetical protein
MAEIQVERKPQHRTGWLVGLLLLVAVLGAGWYFMMGPGVGTIPLNEEPDVQEPPASMPYTPPPPQTQPPVTAPQPGGAEPAPPGP